MLIREVECEVDEAATDFVAEMDLGGRAGFAASSVDEGTLHFADPLTDGERALVPPDLGEAAKARTLRVRPIEADSGWTREFESQRAIQDSELRPRRNCMANLSCAKHCWPTPTSAAVEACGLVWPGAPRMRQAEFS